MGAQAEPFSSHYRKVFGFVRRRVATVEDAEDLTQEVFANAAARLGARSGDPPTLAWLYVVAQRRIVDEARRRGPRSMPLELVPSPDPAESRLGPGVVRALDAALATMPEGQRRVVLGRLIQGLSFADLGRELGTTEEACRMRFTRGLQHVRDEFAKEGLEP